MKLVKDIDKSNPKKPEVTDKQAEEAFRTILTWIGEDPKREGLIETPKRVVKAFKEYFKGYHQNANTELLKTFGDVDGYDDMVVEKNISFESHCEHHMAPIIGVTHIAYIPNKKVVRWHIFKFSCGALFSISYFSRCKVPTLALCVFIFVLSIISILIVIVIAIVSDIVIIIITITIVIAI